MALPFTLKSISKAKRRCVETQIFHHAKKKKSFENTPKEIKNPSR
jgi:hypothetical protein